MSSLVHYTVEGSVARLTLDSPDNRNALSTALVNQLHQGLPTPPRSRGAGVVLDHTGGTFCAGADLAKAAPAAILAMSPSTGPRTDPPAAPDPQAADAGDRRRRRPRPRGGLGLVGACDIVVAGQARARSR